MRDEIIKQGKRGKGKDKIGIVRQFENVSRIDIGLEFPTDLL
jgi:hypothetical protein